MDFLTQYYRHLPYAYLWKCDVVATQLRRTEFSDPKFVRAAWRFPVYVPSNFQVAYEPQMTFIV